MKGEGANIQEERASLDTIDKVQPAYAEALARQAGFTCLRQVNKRFGFCALISSNPDHPFNPVKMLSCLA